MMTLFVDARVPVLIGPAELAGPESAVLAEGRDPAEAAARFVLPAADAGHIAGCACCVPRGPVSDALNQLFLARARGEVSFFRAVVAAPATEAGAAAIRQALAEDPVTMARFRLAEAPASVR